MTNTELDVATRMHDPQSSARSHASASALVLLFSLALLPRITGLITFWNVDEPWGLSVRVLTGQINEVGTWPPLLYYLNAAFFVVLYAIGRLIGVWHGTADFRAQYFHDPTPFIFAGRLVSVCIGSLSAPLAVLIASRLGLTWRKSLAVGGLVALFPMNVWLSHVSKPDIGSASAVLLLAWSILRKWDNHGSKWPDAMVGAALAVALSFKPTALLVIAPCLIGFVAILRWDGRQSWSQIARGLLVSFVVCVLTWIPLNIGLLLGMEGFLRFLHHQSVTQRHGGSLSDIAKSVVPVLVSNTTGLTAPALAVWLFAPLLRRDWKFLVLWGSTVLGILAFAAFAGTGAGTRARDMLSPAELAFTLTCIAALSLTERSGISKLAGLSLTVAILAGSIIGSAQIVRVALATPMSARCAQVIKAIARPERDKILAAGHRNLLGVPISAAAADEERERHVRLAKKYGIELGERAKERIAPLDELNRGYHIRAFPGVSGGLEDLSPEAAADVVVPYVWPIQDEEYDLDYWTSQGFNIFVVQNHAFFLNCPTPQFRKIHRQIEERCELIANLPTSRRLFYESDTMIFRLRGHPKGS